MVCVYFFWKKNTNEVRCSEIEKTVFVTLRFCAFPKHCGLPCSFLVGVEWIPRAGCILTRKVLGPGIQPLRRLRGAGGGAYIYMGTTVGHPPQSVIIQIMLAICH